MNFNHYPTDNRGLVLPSTEFYTPDTRLNVHKRGNVNNHHLNFTARQMSRFVITQTLRDLDTNQEQIPIDVHNWIHGKYEPPKMPKMSVIMDRLEEAFENDEQLRLGSANNPAYIPITVERWERIQNEYSSLRGQVA